MSSKAPGRAVQCLLKHEEHRGGDPLQYVADWEQCQKKHKCEWEHRKEALEKFPAGQFISWASTEQISLLLILVP